jgi:hypothetical protein
MSQSAVPLQDTPNDFLAVPVAVSGHRVVEVVDDNITEPEIGTIATPVHKSTDVVGPYLAPVRSQLQSQHKKEFDNIKKKIDKLQFSLQKKKDMSAHFAQSVQDIQ